MGAGAIPSYCYQSHSASPQAYQSPCSTLSSHPPLYASIVQRSLPLHRPPHSGSICFAGDTLRVRTAVQRLSLKGPAYTVAVQQLRGHRALPTLCYLPDTNCASSSCVSD